MIHPGKGVVMSDIKKYIKYLRNSALEQKEVEIVFETDSEMRNDSGNKACSLWHLSMDIVICI